MGILAKQSRCCRRGACQEQRGLRSAAFATALSMLFGGSEALVRPLILSICLFVFSVCSVAEVFLW